MSIGPNSSEDLPEDDWHTYVYVFLDATCCTECGLEPDIMGAWDNVPSGEAGVVVYAIRVVKCLKDAGWQMRHKFPWCPDCAAKLFPEISD